MLLFAPYIHYTITNITHFIISLKTLTFQIYFLSAWGVLQNWNAAYFVSQARFAYI